MIASSGHGWGLAVFPLGAAAIAAVFGAMLLVRFLRKRRTYEGIWSLALFMFAAASFATFLGVVDGWTATDLISAGPGMTASAGVAVLPLSFWAPRWPRAIRVSASAAGISQRMVRPFMKFPPS